MRAFGADDEASERVSEQAESRERGEERLWYGSIQ
jgi:hypothetical protein